MNRTRVLEYICSTGPRAPHLLIAGPLEAQLAYVRGVWKEIDQAVGEARRGEARGSDPTAASCRWVGEQAALTIGREREACTYVFARQIRKVAKDLAL